MAHHLLENWNICNKVTLDILENIPTKLYFQKPFNDRFTSFSWEYSCILTTREMYINGIEKLVLNGKTKCLSENLAEKISQQLMKNKLKKLDSKIKNIILHKNNQKINFFGALTPIPQVISWLLQHEQLHFGKLMLYCAKVNIPQSQFLLKMWGKDSFVKKKL